MTSALAPVTRLAVRQPTARRFVAVSEDDVAAVREATPTCTGMPTQARRSSSRIRGWSLGAGCCIEARRTEKQALARPPGLMSGRVRLHVAIKRGSSLPTIPHVAPLVWQTSVCYRRRDLRRVDAPPVPLVRR